MKIPLVQVPDFWKEVEEDTKALPPFFHSLSPADQDEYRRSVTLQRSVLWACKTAASAYNLGMIVGLAVLAVNGAQIYQLAAAYLKGH